MMGRETKIMWTYEGKGKEGREGWEGTGKEYGVGKERRKRKVRKERIGRERKGKECEARKRKGRKEK